MSTLWISWSSLKVHEECHQKGKLSRERKRAPLKDQRLFFAGTTVDRVVRDWLDGEPEKNPGGMALMVEEIMEREKGLIEEAGGVMRWKSTADRDEVLTDCIEAVTRLEPILEKHVLPYEWDVDYRFKVPVRFPHPKEGHVVIILNGAMDIIVRDRKSLEETFWDIWDVKMTRDNSYWRKTAGQITFYDNARALHLPGTRRNSGLLQPMCDERVKPYPVTEDLVKQMRARIARMVGDVYSENFELTPNRSLCGVCDVKHACPRFKSVVSGGQRRISLVGG